MPRPQKKFDPVIADEIQRLRAQGVSVKDVCSLLAISEKTIRRIYKNELEKGKSQANAAITGRLFELCMSGNVTALIFWAKTQMKWKEREEEQGADIEALKAGIKSAFDSVGNGGQKETGVLIVPGILSESEWEKEANKYSQEKQ